MYDNVDIDKDYPKHLYIDCALTIYRLCYLISPCSNLRIHTKVLNLSFLVTSKSVVRDPKTRKYCLGILYTFAFNFKNILKIVKVG